MTINIRKENPQDVHAIREVNVKAFGQPQEADIVDKLRKTCDGLLSLVAIVNKRPIGHILFSPAEIVGEGRTLRGMGLAPMAVLPEYQRQGIGSELVKNGIERLSGKGCPFIIVLGHAEYYPRFGFEPAGRYGVKSEWEVPEAVFKILVLDRSAMLDISGVAVYRPEFSEAV
jgi:putative acetyltransferase